MGFLGNRSVRVLNKTFRANFDDGFSVYEAGVKKGLPSTPWPPKVSYVAHVFDQARRFTTKGRPLPEATELAFLDLALSHAAARAHVDHDLLSKAAQVMLAKRNYRDAEHRRQLDAILAEIDAEQVARSA